MKTLTPHGSAYRGVAVQLDLPVLEAGIEATISAPEGIEVAVVLLAGDLNVDGQRVRRLDVFDDLATAVYLPPASSITVSANAHTEIALAATVGGELESLPGARPIVIEPAGVAIHDRGRPGWQRQVHDVITDDVPAQRLLVGETFNAAGEWSSFPPHKHDGGDGEPALEEVYYYRFDRRDGFGFQGLYTEAGVGREASERAVFLRHGAVVGIPSGYHPVCAAPGYRLYYLWALAPVAGAARALALHEDPAHRWLHELPTAVE